MSYKQGNQLVRDSVDSTTTLDGSQFSLTIRLPARIHIAALTILGCLVLTAWKAPIAIGPMLGIGGILLAFYTAFYTRQAIVVSRDRAKIIDTVHFSRHVSEGGLFDARDRLSARFQFYYLHTDERMTEEARSERATELLRDELVRQSAGKCGKHGSTPQPETPGSDVDKPEKYDPDLTLLDDARKVADYFEDLAVGIKFDVFDERAAKSLLRSLLIDSYRSIEGFVKHQRLQKKAPDSYIHFQRLYDKWKS